jgi:hypothetical protein
LIVLTKRSAYALRFWRPRRQADRLHAGRSQRVTKRIGEARIAIMKEEAFRSQESVNRIGELATALDHPGTVRLGEDASDLHASRREVDHEHDGEARQSSSGPNLNREEIRGRHNGSVRAQELLPGCPLLPLRSGFNPVLPQDGGDGPSADVMMEVGERALNPRIAPRAIVRRHPDNPLADLRRDGWPARAAPQGIRAPERAFFEPENRRR